MAELCACAGGLREIVGAEYSHAHSSQCTLVNGDFEVTIVGVE